MKPLVVSMVAVALFIGQGAVVAQSRSGSIQGVWQTIEVNIAGANPRTITVPKPGPWLTIFTARN